MTFLFQRSILCRNINQNLREKLRGANTSGFQNEIFREFLDLEHSYQLYQKEGKARSTKEFLGLKKTKGTYSSIKIKAPLSVKSGQYYAGIMVELKVWSK